MEFDVQRAIEAMDGRLTTQLTLIHDDARSDAGEIKALMTNHEKLDTQRFGSIDTAMKEHGQQLTELGVVKRALYFAIGALVVTIIGVAVDHGFNHNVEPRPSKIEHVADRPK